MQQHGSPSHPPSILNEKQPVSVGATSKDRVNRKRSTRSSALASISGSSRLPPTPPSPYSAPSYPRRPSLPNPISVLIPFVLQIPLAAAYTVNEAENKVKVCSANPSTCEGAIIGEQVCGVQLFLALHPFPASSHFESLPLRSGDSKTPE